MIRNYHNTIFTFMFLLAAHIPQLYAQQAKTTEEFVETIGVNIHFSSYPDYQTKIKPRLQELGIRHVRDGIQPRLPHVQQKFKDLYQTLGIKTCLITSNYEGTPAECLNEVKNNIGIEAAAFIEGINEPDTRGGNWVIDSREYQKQIYNAFKGDPETASIPILSPSLTGSFETLGNLTAYCDYGNVHNYYGGRNPETGGWGDNGYGGLWWNFNYAAKPVSGTKPIVATETGWHNAVNSTDGHKGTPVSVVTKYMPRLFFHHFNNGVVKSYPYEFIDEGSDILQHESNFGILYNDLTPKPAFYVIKNLISLLKDPGADFTPNSLTYTLTGNTGSVNKTLLQKRDGTFFLALWLGKQRWNVDTKTDSDIPSQDVVLNLPASITNAKIYSFANNGSISNQVATITTNTINLSVHDQVIIVELSSTTPPANVAPTVSITSPAAGATFTSPASITINATATDADGTISKVEFYQGTTKLGEDLTSPHSYTWSGVATGTYSLTAKAFDNDAATKTSASVSITVSDPANVAPTVSITSPAAGAMFTSPASITLNATATDADGTISKVEFYQGTTKLGEDLTSPHSYTWSGVAAGTYSLTAKAFDNDGATKTSASVSITVNDPANVAPTVSISSPAAGATFTSPASITIDATASDADGTISKVEFYQGTIKLGEDLTSPYIYTWSSVIGGTYSLTAKAFDNGGANTTSASVSITINGPANVAPTVSITSPASGATFTSPAIITIEATATDTDGTISLVEFYDGTTKIGESSTSPFNFTWNGVMEGSYSITAKATDNNGETATSTAISIVVNNQEPGTNLPPSVKIISPLTNSTVLSGSPITISAEATDSDGTIVSVIFFDGEIQLNENSVFPDVFVWMQPSDGVHSITAKATDNLGAVTTSEIVIIIVSKDVAKDNTNVKPRNLFTPNGDGKNDYWEIENIQDYPEFRIAIFNRQGVKVYDKMPYVNWDGRTNGIPANAGVYFYQIKSANKKIKSGSITLVR